jgi:glycosyltransferase involved in cell wall biosynthesis
MNPSQREPRVLFLSQAYPPAFSGGGQYLAMIRKAITRRGFPSQVIAGDRGLPGPPEPGVLRLPSPGGETMPRLGAYCFALLTPFALLAQRRRYDLIQAMGNSYSVYGAILTGRLLRKAVVVSSIMNRHDDPSGILPQRFGKLKNAIFARASRFVCCSGLQLEAYRRAGYPEAKVVFIPNGVDPARFAPCASEEERARLRSSLGLPAGEFIAVSVGAMIERKGIDLLAEAWIRFRSGRDRGLLLLAGPDRSTDRGSGVDDRFIAALKARLAAAGVSGSVRFTGKVPNVPDFLRAGDAFFLMSRGEGFPVAILEAMLTELPVVLWGLPDYGGYDLADGANVLLLPPFNVEALAATFARLADDAALRRRLGLEGRTLASRFTLERSMAGYAGVYQSLVSD